MNRRYRPPSPPRALPTAAAALLTVAVLAGVHVEAGRRGSPPAIDAVFTGEVTAAGPVYRLPSLEVRGSRAFALALPATIDRAPAVAGAPACNPGA